MTRTVILSDITPNNATIGQILTGLDDDALDALAQAEERERLGVRAVVYRGKTVGAVTEIGDGGWYASTEMWLDDDVLVNVTFPSARDAASALVDALAAVHDLDADEDEIAGD